MPLPQSASRGHCAGGAPGIVQTHLVDGSVVGLAAARLARTPVAVMTAQGRRELPFHGRKLVWTERLCAGPLCDHIIAPSHDALRTLIRVARVPPEKIEVVHHGFDLERLDPRKADPSRVRHELGLKGKLVFGAIGRLYGVEELRGADRGVRSALADVPEARLVIIGPGHARAAAPAQESGSASGCS